MARIRKFVAYRRLERPYTRKSKFREKSFIRASPRSKIVRYVMGDTGANHPDVIQLVAKQDLQIRDNAIESARQVVLRRLERTVGKTGFTFKMRVFPHHMLRENPLAAGAGADRMSTGMKMAFGKVIGVAAQVREGQPVMEIAVPANQPERFAKVKTALALAGSKLPGSYSLVQIKRE